jgi:ABC-type branched-subunit amino acid transport system substrate-binding protein
MQAGLKAALEEANAKGGVKGRKIKLLSADDEYEPEKCVDCTASMIENSHVSILAGYVGTPTAKVAVPIVQESKTPLIGIFSGAMLLREPVQRYVLNVRASYDDETEELVKYLGDKLGNRKIAVLYQNDSFGLAGLGGTEKALGRRGLKLAAKGSFERNTIAVKSGLADILSGNPDAVIMVGPYKPIAEFVRQAHAAGLKSVLANIAANLTNMGEEEGQYYHFLRVAVLAFVKGASPMTAVEFAQRSQAVRSAIKIHFVNRCRSKILDHMESCGSQHPRQSERVDKQSKRFTGSRDSTGERVHGDFLCETQRRTFDCVIEDHAASNWHRSDERESGHGPFCGPIWSDAEP